MDAPPMEMYTGLDAMAWGQLSPRSRDEIQHDTPFWSSTPTCPVTAMWTVSITSRWRAPGAPEGSRYLPTAIAGSPSRTGSSLSIWWTRQKPPSLAPRPQVEGVEADRRPLGIGAVVEGAVDAADGVQAHLQRVLDGKLRMADREPTLAIGAAEGVHARTQPLQAKEDRLGGQAAAADDDILLAEASLEGDLMFTTGAPIEAEVIPFVFPEQQPASRGPLLRRHDANGLDGEVPGNRSHE